MALPPDLEAVNISKHFGSVMALDQVSLHLRPATFHALLGENGAGKSTLVKCIMGFYRPDHGDVLIGQKSRDIRNPRDAYKYGVGMVYQHFTVIPAMTVAENLVIARTEPKTILNWAKELEELREFMEESPFQINLHIPVSQLSAGEKQKLEILKQLYLKSKILILDEPTSVLTPAEADEVLGLLRQQVADQNLSVLMITHKFREVITFADEVTVLRKGKFAGFGLVKDLSVADLGEMMLGEPIEAHQLPKAALDHTEPILQIQQLRANKDSGLEAIAGIDLTVHRGEIVGIAGVSGNGQRELVEVLAGQRQPTAGEICVNGQPYQPKRDQMYKNQVHVLPEEPLRNACVPQMSVAENMALRTFDRPPHCKAGIWLVFQAIRATARNLIKQFSIRTPSEDTPIVNLSGGNVQRTVLARELSAPHVNLLIVANPCFGLDFHAAEFIHTALVESRNRGAGILLVSEDVDELIKLADRILVISGGQFLYETTINQLDFAALSQSMAGH